MPPLFSKTMRAEEGDGARFEECECTTTVFLSPLSLLSSAPLPLPLLSSDKRESGGHCGELISLFIICIPIPILDAVRVSVVGYFYQPRDNKRAGKTVSEGRKKEKKKRRDGR